MDTLGLLKKLHDKLTLDEMIELIRNKKTNWTPTKKPRRKADVKNDFLALTDVIKDEELKGLVEMAVLKKQIGLPAYTYTIDNVSAIENLKEYDEYPINSIFCISFKIIENNQSNFRAIVFVKEYEDQWRTGTQDLISMTAVYKSEVQVDKLNRKVSIYVGNQIINEVIRQFMIQVQELKISYPRIPNKIVSMGPASYKTILLIDYIYNRLLRNGISSQVIDIKFKTGESTGKQDGLTQVTLHGDRNILSSDLSCQYITLGCDIVMLKIDMSYKNSDFSVILHLIGESHDTVKLVITGNEDVVIKKSIMNILQEEYISMCNNGVFDEGNTKNVLDKIYDTFLSKDKVI
ncbi:hypothetical protein ABH14_03105 [Brevibacillus brevis]|uniref:hypothetical protein n=1 Tax=Brevibacillus brevis TaxID=1393 RepID=UPI001901DF01|nr:hypothetical protein [Brevibacillus brevis]MBH0328792.1 hypothetical protein [Brevibacillus brevis]